MEQGSLEQERIKNDDLVRRLAETEEKNRQLEAELKDIKENFAYRATGPARRLTDKVGRQVERVRNQGSVRGVLSKVKWKLQQKQCMKRYGKASFPGTATIQKEKDTSFETMPMISILTPVYNNSAEFTRQLLDSILDQTYENWQLCLADGSDAEHAYIKDIVEEYQKKDLELLKASKGTHFDEKPSESRITYHKLEQNTGISGNTNECLKMAKGSYIGLIDQDDLLHPEALFLYVEAINKLNADYIYSDEVTFSGNDIDHMLTMHFKPDYAVDNLRANNYICHFSCFKRSLLDGTELFRTQFDGSQDHDMILRLTDAAEHIVHIPRMLYYWRSHAGSVASGIEAKPYAIEAARGAVADHLRRHGYENFKITSTRAFPTIFKISYAIVGKPMISIVIPTCEHKEDLERCIRSIEEKSVYDHYEIVVVENNSKSQEIRDYYKSLEADAKVRVVDYSAAHPEQKTFNYSAVVNYGVSQSKGDYILLLNNDVEVISSAWMEEMLCYAQREDVGAVGAKLYFPNGKIQHAGVVLGLGAHRTAGHSHYNQPGRALGYMGRLCYTQNVSAVTGACLMVKRSAYDKVGGFDESLAVSLNDVDFCLKLREEGLLNIFTPFAELTHYESASRGLDTTGANAERYNAESAQFKEKWKAVLDAGDPYYNVNFTLDKSDYSLRV
ncbi:MAG: glycosyltransferase [Lachnospiraceae bacterium]|nr:glycosyltransferase [Lachnospiraceae bacterium]